MTNDVTQAQAATRLVRYTKTLIVVSEGPDAGKRLEIAGTPVRVGTSPENTLVLSDGTVSRSHAEILPHSGGVRVRDEGSLNGIFVNGVRIFDAVFAEGFSLRLGQTLLKIEPLSDVIDRAQSTGDSFGDMLGQSACMRELFADLMRIAPTEVSVLIEGETGTGKELVADSIHVASPRAGGPFVVFDCSAIAATLVESELFGHERGAFTGAVASRPGVFEQASGGTLFLDELGELPKDLQPKLLRVLEKREVKRIGSNRTTPVDIRLIAATNRNLLAEVERGNFREDVYFRIAATHVYVPPLRDRLDDLPMLVAHFLKRSTPPRGPDALPEQVWEMLRAYRWPGNVRELQNAVQRLLITPERGLGGPQTRPSPSVPPPATNPEPLRIARRDAADEFERNYLQHVLTRTAGNVTRAAAIAEVSRQMVQKLMRKHGL